MPVMLDLMKTATGSDRKSAASKVNTFGEGKQHLGSGSGSGSRPTSTAHNLATGELFLVPYFLLRLRFDHRMELIFEHVLSIVTILNAHSQNRPRTVSQNHLDTSGRQAHLLVSLLMYMTE